MQLVGRSTGEMTFYLETLQGVGYQKTGIRGQAQEMPGVGKPKEMWRPSMRNRAQG